MTQLAEAVSATEKLWRVDSIPSQRFLRVESELVEVTTRYPMKSLIRVRRAQEGTTAASHADETELTPVYLGMSDQLGGEEQIISLLGPFTKTAAQVNAGTSVAPGKKLNLVAINANVVVLSAWCFFTDGWAASSGTAYVTLGVDLESDGFDMIDVKRYESQSGDPLAGGAHTEDESILGTTNTVTSQIVRRTAAGNLYIYAERAATGTAEVYALIATPV